MLLDAIIAGLLTVTCTYCFRLNRRIASFRNAKNELDHMIRSFDGAIRQAYESIAVLKENSSDKNMQLIRDMEKVRFLANDLAYLVEKGEKLADTLETSVRAPSARGVALNVEGEPIPAPRPKMVRPQLARKQVENVAQLQPRVAQVQNMIDTLARSYVTGATTPPPSLPQRSRPIAQQTQQKTAYSQKASPEQRAEAIEKVLSHMAAKNAQGVATMPAVPPRAIIQKMEQVKVATAAVPPTKQRFFDTLRVITPNE
jgi:hypothetical protein